MLANVFSNNCWISVCQYWLLVFWMTRYHLRKTIRIRIEELLIDQVLRDPLHKCSVRDLPTFKNDYPYEKEYRKSYLILRGTWMTSKRLVLSFRARYKRDNCQYIITIYFQQGTFTFVHFFAFAREHALCEVRKRRARRPGVHLNNKKSLSWSSDDKKNIK